MIIQSRLKQKINFYIMKMITPNFYLHHLFTRLKKIIRNLLHILVLVMMIYFYITKPINNVLYVENYYLKN